VNAPVLREVLPAQATGGEVGDGLAPPGEVVSFAGHAGSSRLKGAAWRSFGDDGGWRKGGVGRWVTHQ
jgi:hypothetical protein